MKTIKTIAKKHKRLLMIQKFISREFSSELIKKRYKETEKSEVQVSPFRRQVILLYLLYFFLKI